MVFSFLLHYLHAFSDPGNILLLIIYLFVTQFIWPLPLFDFSVLFNGTSELSGVSILQFLSWFFVCLGPELSGQLTKIIRSHRSSLPRTHHLKNNWYAGVPPLYTYSSCTLPLTVTIRVRIPYEGLCVNSIILFLAPLPWAPLSSGYHIFYCSLSSSSLRDTV